MIKIENKEQCCGCTVCVASCPKKCISMKVDEEGFYYPEVDETKCIQCNKCNLVCPTINKPNYETDYRDNIFAARALDSDIREKSSSGGIATMLSRVFIKNSNVVFGVAMSQDYSFSKHICVNDFEELERIQGSKYIQSHMDGVIERIKIEIGNNKKVLFIGTPCQVAGVKKIFENVTNDIFYIDIICHGVPTEKLWIKYLDFICSKFGSRILNINFRDKRNGWEEFGLSIEFENGKEIYSSRHNGFIGLFLKNICLRPSCAKCVHKGFDRSSDLTLGDFWGIERVYPEYQKKNGVSLVMINSKRGEELLDLISNEIEMTKVDCKDLFMYRNKSMIRSVIISDRRREFMNDLSRLSFNRLEKKYLGRQYLYRIKKKIIKIMSRDKEL